MKFLEFERQVLPRIVLPLIGGLFLLTVLHPAAQAEQTTQGAQMINGGAPVNTSYVVNAADGYGVNDCIKNGAACAQIVADAWCEAHGHASSVGYGRAADATAAIKPVASKSQAYGEDDVIIACGE